MNVHEERRRGDGIKLTAQVVRPQVPKIAANKLNVFDSEFRCQLNGSSDAFRRYLRANYAGIRIASSVAVNGQPKGVASGPVQVIAGGQLWLDTSSMATPGRGAYRG